MLNKARALFLLERVRIVRAPFVKRTRDPIWIVGGIATICGYTAVMGVEYVAPEAELSRIDGICRIGIQPEAAIAMIALDTSVNVILTGIFIWQLRPAAVSLVRHPGHVTTRARRTSSLSWMLKREENGLSSTGRSLSEKNLNAMLVRNVVASILLLLNTVIPNIIFLTWPAARMSHACLLLCLTDSKFDPL